MRKLIVQQWGDRRQHRCRGGRRTQLRVRGTLRRRGHRQPLPEQPGFIDSVDTMILAANTYNMTKDYWPNATDQGECGEKLNNLTKYVASSPLDDAPWGGFPATTVTGDPAATIRELKDQPGKDLWLWKSLKLMHSPMETGVIDEIRMLVCPTSRGTGTRIFADRHDLNRERPLRSRTAWHCCATSSRTSTASERRTSMCRSGGTTGASSPTTSRRRTRSSIELGLELGGKAPL